MSISSTPNRSGSLYESQGVTPKSRVKMRFLVPERRDVVGRRVIMNFLLCAILTPFKRKVRFVGLTSELDVIISS